MNRRSGTKKRRSRRTTRDVAVIVLAIVVGAIVGALVGGDVMGRALRFYDAMEAPHRITKGSGSASVPGKGAWDPAPQNIPRVAPARVPDVKGRVVLVIDDLGPNLEIARAFSKLNIPFVAAVLPGYVHTRKIADLMRAEGHDVLLHQPMEAGAGSPWPGPGTISRDMTHETMRAVFMQNVEETGSPTLGVNNHMGSRFTADPEAMNRFMTIVRETGMFFLDSRTTKETVAETIGRRAGVPVLSRGVFLDAAADTEPLSFRWRQAVARAAKGEFVIVIGHGRRDTVRFLKAMEERGTLPRFAAFSDILAPSLPAHASVRRETGRGIVGVLLRDEDGPRRNRGLIQ